MDYIEQLKSLHYKCREYLDKKDYTGLVNFINEFTKDFLNPNELNGINELKTILIAISQFKNNPILSPIIQQLEIVFNQKLSLPSKL